MDARASLGHFWAVYSLPTLLGDGGKAHLGRVENLLSTDGVLAST